MHGLDSVAVTVRGQVAIVSLTREEALNALNSAVLKSLDITLRELEEHCRGEHPYGRFRGVILTGAGEKAFAAGADIKELERASAEELREFILLGQGVMRRIESLPLPVIAAINGFAMGGGLELALASDLIVASDNARLGLPEVGLGLIPGFGGTQRLALRAGIGVAKRLIFTADPISTEEALALGIVDSVVPHGELIARAFKIAEGIAERGPLAIAAAKRAIHAGFVPHIESGLSVEVMEFLRNSQTGDAREGLTAFRERRKPNFRGR